MASSARKMSCESVPTLAVDRSMNFTDDLLHNLYEMKTRADMTDFTIKVHEVSIACHSVVVAAASPYFKALLTCSLMEAEEKLVQLDSLNDEYLQRVVDYCYTGKIAIQLDTAHLCLEIVEYFQLPAIKQRIEAFVCDHVAPENCIGWFFRADKYNLARLKVEAQSMMTSQFPDVIKYEEFRQLTHHELISYISEDIAVADRGTILSACVDWMHYDVNERSEQLLEILPNVPLNRCSQSRLKHVLKSFDPMCPNYTQIQEMFIAAILDSIPDHVTIRNQKLSILVAGGFTDGAILNCRYWKLNLINGECELLGNMPERVVKYCSAQTAIEGGMLFAGGSQSCSESVPTEHCAMYIHRQRKWLELPPLPTPADGATAVCVGKSVIVIGGTESRRNVMECLDLEATKWRGLPRLVQRTNSPLVESTGDSIYIIMNNSNPLLAMSMQCYDLQSETWQLRKLPEELQLTKGASVLVVDGDLFMVGGEGRLCARYQPSNDYWTTSSLKRPRKVHRYGSAVAVDGQIFLCGGWDEQGRCHDIIEVYDVNENAWAISDVKLPLPLRSHLCVVD